MKIGMYGGSFDPPHVGHMIVATRAMDQLGLKYLFMIPTGEEVSATEKKTVASAVDRHMMVTLATLGTQILPSSVETHKTEPVKTIDTVRLFAHNWSRIKEEVELWFIMGSDSWASFHTWDEHEEIRKLCKIAVLPRHGAILNWGAAPDAILEVPENSISSTWIREHVNNDLSWLVPESVIEYIREHNLYG